MSDLPTPLPITTRELDVLSAFLALLIDGAPVPELCMRPVQRRDAPLNRPRAERKHNSNSSRQSGK